MNDEYTKIDAPMDRFMGIKRVVDKKTKKVRRYMTTPVQPTRVEEPVDNGYDLRMSQGPMAKAKSKIKRYSA